MSATSQGPPPFPAPLTAVGLSALAFLLMGLVGAALGGGIAGIAFGAALGYGGLGTLAARLVPAPVDRRLGLAPFPLRAALPVVLLLPVVLVFSELDNWIRAAFGGSAPSDLGEASAPSAQLALFGVLLLPVLQEFLFRGVLLQGCVSALGRLRGVLFVAALEVMPRSALALSPEVDTAGAASALAQFFLLSALLGLVRLATGSLLPGIALAGGIAGLGLAASAFAEQVPVPGFNAPGGATPLAVLLPAAVSVALGLQRLHAELAKQPPLPPIPAPASRQDDEESGGLL